MTRLPVDTGTDELLCEISDKVAIIRIQRHKEIPLPAQPAIPVR